MNANKLRSKMALHGDTGEVLSEYLNISQQTLSAKLNGKREFKQGEILSIKDKYDLLPEEIDDIFFDNEVS